MKLREIERLRGVAILMVMTHHWNALHDLLPEVARSPWSGVDLFFVISGYVVTLSLLRLLPPFDASSPILGAFALASLPLRKFYARRFFRILPAALAGVLIERALMALFPGAFGTPSVWLVEVITFFGGIYNYVFPFHSDFHLGVYWSLSVEEHFYLLLPILFVAFRTNGLRFKACIAVGAMSIVARALPPPDGVDVSNYEAFSSHLRFDSLMAGVALALLSSKTTTRPVMPRAMMRYLIVPAALLLLGCLPATAPNYVLHRQGFILFWVISGFLVSFASKDVGYVLSFPLVAPFLELVGSRSYALYIVHVLAGRLDGELARRWRIYARIFPRGGAWPWREALSMFLVAILMAELLHRIVERPLMRVGRRIIGADRESAAVPELRGGGDHSPN